MRKTGVTFLVIAYAIFFYIAISAPPYARAHPQLAPELRAAYSAPWPLALTYVFAFSGVVLALIPIRAGQRWAIWTSLVAFLTLFGARLATDPRCLVVLDPHQHGCHTFMIAVVLGIAGLALCALGRPPAAN
ncbi:MAG TPA: hypothetical protein VFO34_01400 [Candidatus Acidoferrales bacterium]|nr:hypothetical protein [Candidatus Acidoferrales bacterium]